MNVSSHSCLFPCSSSSLSATKLSKRSQTLPPFLPGSAASACISCYCRERARDKQNTAGGYVWHIQVIPQQPSRSTVLTTDWRGRQSRIKTLCFHFILKIRSCLIHIFVLCLGGKELNIHSNVHEESFVSDPVVFFVPSDVRRTRNQALCGS